MSDARAIKATFSTWRPVNGRKVLQLVFEVPIEQQGEVLTMLGAPDDKWCAIAVLNTKPAEVPRCSVNHADYIGKCPGCHVALPGIPSQRGTTLDQAFVEPAAKSGGRGDSRERPAQPKKRFEDLPLVQQAGMRCAEPDFRRFLEAYMGVTPGSATEDVAAALVRDFCRVESRADLDRLPEAGNCWRVLESSFQRYILDQRYPAGARR